MLKYTQAYTMFKEMIADGRLRRGERMPSIRRAAELYRISRTTVGQAELITGFFSLPSAKS